MMNTRGSGHKTITAAIIVVAILTGTAAYHPIDPEGIRLAGIVDNIKAQMAGMAQSSQVDFDSTLVLKGDRYDVNAYFTVLNRIRMEPGYILDWVYARFDLDGRPFLYSRKNSDEPFETFEEYDSVHGGYIIESMRPKYEFWEHILVDGTGEGFFQLTVMLVVCPKFFLCWHSNYMDNEIICSRAALKEVIFGEYFNEKLPDSTQRKAQSIDVTPWLTVNTQNAFVSIVMFSKWGGFRRLTFIYSKSFPHRLLDVNSTTLVAYDCGVCF